MIDVATSVRVIATASDNVIIIGATFAHIHLSAGCALACGMRACNAHVVDVKKLHVAF